MTLQYGLVDLGLNNVKPFPIGVLSYNLLI